VGDYDVYYVPSQTLDPYPPDFSSYINGAAVTSAIGAKSTWTQNNNQIYSNFANTGDWIKSAESFLEKVIDAGVRTALYAGDAVRQKSIINSRS
jgi:hypothetical protein